MKNKAQLKESMVVILQWSSGHSVVVCSGSCLGLGLKTGLFHYLLHIRIKNYIKCHSLREFLTHAQVVYNAALFQITGFQSFQRETQSSCTLELEDFYWPIVIRDEFLLIDLNKGIIQLISNSKKITYLHVESSTVVWPPLLYFLSSPSLAGKSVSVDFIYWYWIYSANYLGIYVSWIYTLVLDIFC